MTSYSCILAYQSIGTMDHVHFNNCLDNGWEILAVSVKYSQHIKKPHLSKQGNLEKFKNQQAELFSLHLLYVRISMPNRKVSLELL